MSADFISFDTIDSTNNFAKDHISTFHPQRITCIHAYQQTAGKGRHGHTWTSPQGGLYCSFCEVSRLQPFQYVQCTVLLLHQFFTEMGITPRIHWPNDIYVENKKISGTLVETAAYNTTPWIIIGIGINCVPVIADQPTISLLELSIQKKEPYTLCLELCAYWEKYLPSYIASDFHAQWKNLCQWMIGTFRHGDPIIDIAPDGRLIVLRDGKQHLVTA